MGSGKSSNSGRSPKLKFSDAAIKNITDVASCMMDLSLTEVVGLLSGADAFLGNDSGITHLSAGLGAKTIAVFCSA